jgi:hypothetical protein
MVGLGFWEGIGRARTSPHAVEGCAKARSVRMRLNVFPLGKRRTRRAWAARCFSRVTRGGQSAPRGVRGAFPADSGVACASLVARLVRGARFPKPPDPKEPPMFCPQCGSSVADGASACGQCHAPVAILAGAGAGAGAAAGSMAVSMKSAFGSALGVLKGLAADPVGRLPSSYAELGDAQARRVGLSYGAFSLACFLLGGYLLLPFKDGLFDFLGFGGVMKCLLFGALPFACTALGSLAVRKALSGSGGGTGGDLFIAGVAVLPVSIAMLLSGLLGFENYGAITVVSVFAGCTGTLILYSGYSRLSKLSERAATLAVPVVVVLALWLGKTVASSVLNGSFGGPVAPDFGQGWPTGY